MVRRVLYARDPRWRAAIERADELIGSARFRRRKAEARTLAGVIEPEDLAPAFLKRVEVRSWARGIAERVHGSRASRALSGARLLERAGIAHPAPLAALNLLRGGAVRASYLVSELLSDADTLSRFALGPRGIKARDIARRKRISDAVARAVRRLHDAGLYTRDLQETNLMIADDGVGGFRVYFIDLEDFRRARGRVSQRRRMLNLVHLDRSIGRFMCRAARLDFFYAYLGGRPSRAEARRLMRRYLALRERVARRHGSAARAALEPARATGAPARDEPARSRAGVPGA
jgi:tRNA A-37 threonylcarbamoyl transferase component Bud32